jgi:hypothetical protein
VKDNVSGVVPDAGVKFVTPGPGFTTRVDGGLEIARVTATEREPTSGVVVTEMVAE